MALQNLTNYITLPFAPVVGSFAITESDLISDLIGFVVRL
jgi:hypothetical protein